MRASGCEVAIGGRKGRCQAFAFVDIAKQPAAEEIAMADKTLDTKGLSCPLPILKTKKAISELPAGATLEVFATDPGALPDFEAFSAATGNALLEHSEEGGVYRVLLQRSGQG
jgi:tRNA 2-thiouridine synthesizing protein A